MEGDPYMTIQQLNYAIAVFRAGSINRAAQKLYIAQPNQAMRSNRWRMN